jgi:hypothetical protein
MDFLPWASVFRAAARPLFNQHEYIRDWREIETLRGIAALEHLGDASTSSAIGNDNGHCHA